MTDIPNQTDSAAPLEFTGERFTPQCVREIWYEHWHRYAMAAALAKDSVVLDLACGEGYGAHLLAQHAREVTGVDCDAKTVAHAQRTYQRANLRYVLGDATAVPAPDHSFDLVVSFETLEHLAEQEQMLDEFRRVLKPDGVLLISSPDKAQYSDATGYDNEFHVRELYRQELAELLAPRFPASRLFGQQLLFQSAIWPLDHAQNGPLVCQQVDDGQLSTSSVPQVAPLYFIAACAARDDLLPPALDATWLFADRDQSVYEHYQHEIRKNMSAGQVINERDAEIARLRAELEQLKRDR